MHDPSIDSSAPLSDWFEGSTLCLRRQDKLAIAAIPDILLGANPYVVVVGPGAALISHYFELIYRQVKAADGMAIEVFLPSTADGLLKRFNDVLAELSVAEARQPPAETARRRILMLSESSDLGAREWDLMARLLSDFPGANFGLLAFIDEPNNALAQGFIKSMGPKLNQCALNFPNGDELQQLLQAATGEGQESHVFDTLRGLSVSFGEAAEPHAQAGVAKPNANDSESGLAPHTSADPERKGFKQLKLLLLGLFVAVVVSVSVSLALNDDLTPESLAELVAGWVPNVIQQGWRDDSPEELLAAEPIQTEPIQPELVQAEPIQPERVQADGEGDTAKRVAIIPSLPGGPETDGTAAERKARLASAIKGSGPQAMVGSPQEVSNSVIEPVASAPVVLPAWLTAVTAKNQPQPVPEESNVLVVSPEPVFKLDPAGYYLQFNALQVEVNATRERERLASSFDTHILRLSSAGGVLFVVVAGPYRTMIDAANAKEAANNVDVLIVQGAQLERRQVLEPESNFER
jgi:hypothetical protein